MRALLLLAAAVMLACCATLSRDEAARVCAVVSATPGYAPSLPDEAFDLTSWQNIELQTNRSDCTSVRPLPATVYRYPKIGFSADGRFATVLVDTGDANSSLFGSRCYLQQTSDQWRLAGCTHEWEF